MADLIKLCDQIEECRMKRSCNANEIVCTKKWVQKYIGDDQNKLLKLEAEIKIHGNLGADMSGKYSLIISFCALVLAILQEINTGTNLYIRFATLSIMLVAVLQLTEKFYARTTRTRRKWIQYIAVVLNDMSK